MDQEIARARIRRQVARFVAQGIKPAGTPMEWHVVQFRAPAEGWDDWIDAYETVSRGDAARQLAELERAAAITPELGVVFRLSSRWVLA